MDGEWNKVYEILVRQWNGAIGSTIGYAGLRTIYIYSRVH